MFRLMMVLIAVIGTTMMGIGVTAVLSMGMPGWKPVALAALAGAIASVPVSWFVARQILANVRS